MNVWFYDPDTIVDISVSISVRIELVWFGLVWFSEGLGSLVAWESIDLMCVSGYSAYA